MHRRSVADGVRRNRATCELRVTFRGGRDRKFKALGDVRTRHASSAPVREQDVLLAWAVQPALSVADQVGGSYARVARCGLGAPFHAGARTPSHRRDLADAQADGFRQAGAGVVHEAEQCAIPLTCHVRAPGASRIACIS